MKVTEDLPIFKKPSDDFTAEFNLTFKAEVTPISFTLFQIIAEDEKPSNLLYDANITLVLKPDKDN